MSSIRILACVTCLLIPTLAQAAGWRVARATNGAPVARLETGDAVIPVIELACDGSSLAVAVQASAPANMRGLPVIFAGSDGKSVSATLPRMGNFASFNGRLPDDSLAQGLGGGWTAWAVQAGNRRLSPPLAGAPAVVRQALANCSGLADASAAVQPPAARGKKAVTGPASPALFADTSLPPVVRADLADFAHNCNYDWKDGELKPGVKRGPALAAPNALQRADFNGDGVDDFVLDTAKLKCTRPMVDQNQSAKGGTLMVYSSQAGGFIHSLDVAYDSWRLVPAARGKSAAIFAHRDYVPADPSAPDGEGDATPRVDETIVMTGPAAWGPSKLGRQDWRLGALSRYPQALRDQFAQWDSSCRAAGRRLNYTEETYGAFTINDAGDLNRDRRPDYVLDVEGVRCGVFEAPPVPAPPYFCGRDCSLIAIVSGPNGSYIADRVQGSITLAGNGDPASTGNGKISWPSSSSAKCAIVEVTYQGTKQVRRQAPCLD